MSLYNGDVTKSNGLALGSVGSDSAFHFVIVLMCVFVLLDYPDLGCTCIYDRANRFFHICV